MPSRCDFANLFRVVTSDWHPRLFHGVALRLKDGRGLLHCQEASRYQKMALASGESGGFEARAHAEILHGLYCLHLQQANWPLRTAGSRKLLAIRDSVSLCSTIVQRTWLKRHGCERVKLRCAEHNYGSTRFRSGRINPSIASSSDTRCFGFKTERLILTPDSSELFHVSPNSSRASD